MLSFSGGREVDAIFRRNQGQLRFSCYSTARWLRCGLFFLSEDFASFLEAVLSRKLIRKQKVEIRNISDRSYSFFFLGSRGALFSLPRRCGYFFSLG